MMYTDLFNPNYKCDPDSREWQIRYEIRNDLKRILELRKRGMHYGADNDSAAFRGILRYMTCVGDINEVQARILSNITYKIERKYR